MTTLRIPEHQTEPISRPRFKVGAFDYEVVIVDQMPLDCDGDECSAIVDFHTGRIEIWQGCRGNRRLQKLMHELCHAWINVHRPQLDEESRCDWIAHFSLWAVGELDRLGLFESIDSLPVECRTVPA